MNVSRRSCSSGLLALLRAEASVAVDALIDYTFLVLGVGEFTRWTLRYFSKIYKFCLFIIQGIDIWIIFVYRSICNRAANDLLLNVG